MVSPDFVSLSEFCAQLPEVACQRRLDCLEYSDAGMDVCVRRETDAIKQDCRRADAGYIDYDGVAAAACLRPLTDPDGVCLHGRSVCSFAGIFQEHIVNFALAGCGTMTCGVGTYCDSSCAQPTCKPARQVGEACTERTLSNNLRPISCDPSVGYCANPDGGSDFTCQPVRAPGERCAVPTECGLGARCAYFGLDAGTSCVQPKPNDAPCTVHQECASNWCLSSGTCGSPVGRACRSSSDCLEACRGLVFDADGGVAAEGTCGGLLGPGEACDRRWGRFPGPCQRGFACLDGVCKSAAPGTQPLGAECPLPSYGYTGILHGGFLACEKGLECVATADRSPPWTGRCATALCPQGDERFALTDGGSTCVPRRGFEEPCAVSAFSTVGRCLADLHCEQGPDGGARCAGIGLDAGCSYTSDCDPSLRCFSGHCTPRAQLSEACSYGPTDCESGLCANGVCEAQCGW